MFCYTCTFISFLRIKLLIWSQTEILGLQISAVWFLFYFLEKICPYRHSFGDDDLF